MAYDEQLASRIRSAIKPMHKQFEEKKMFGGLSFMYKGKMSVGIIKQDLCVRVIEKNYPNLFKDAGVRPMDFTKKPMKDFVYVSPSAIKSEEDLMTWINRGIEHAESKL